ncbi:1678_t:CDS:2 [Funneliformis geosporum]|nr:1678_t:CDS:2 [Funneliformis geosporum]
MAGKKIKRLERKPNRTPEEEAELADLRTRLRELERKTNSEPFNYTPWIIGGSVLVLGIIIIWLVINKSITKLDISGKQLAGELDLNQYTELEELNCMSNNLNKLSLSGCLNLRKLLCSYNNLNDLDLSNNSNLAEIDCWFSGFLIKNFLTTLSNPEKIVRVSLRENRLLSISLDEFTQLVNLNTLDLYRTNSHGSLSSLRHLEHLEHINVSHTKINSDIEHLPTNLKTIVAENMPEFEEKMGDYGDEN